MSHAARKNAQRYKHQRMLADDHWKALNAGEKAQWTIFKFLHNKPPAYVPSKGDPKGTAAAEAEDAQTSAMLFTFHGDSGQTNPHVQELVQQGLQGEDLSEGLRGVQLFEELGKRFLEHMTHVTLALGWSKVSVAVERCQKAAEGHPARVHLHAFLSGHDSSAKVRVKHLAKAVTFEKQICAHHQSQNCPNGSEAHKAKRANEGHYYLQFVKLGSLWREST